MSYGGETYGGVAYAEEQVDVVIEVTAGLVTFDAPAPSIDQGVPQAPPAAEVDFSAPVPTVVVVLEPTAPAVTFGAPAPGVTVSVLPPAALATFAVAPPATRTFPPAALATFGAPVPTLAVVVEPPAALVTFAGVPIAAALHSPVSDLPTALELEVLAIELELSLEATCEVEETTPVLAVSSTNSQLALTEPATLELDDNRTELVLDG